VISRIVLILVSVALLAGCGSGDSGGKNSVVAAFYPLAYAAEKIGGPRYHVENLTPPGAEPHDLELTPREVGGIVNASVVLYLSHGFQPAVSKAVEQARGLEVDVLAGLPLHRNVGGEAGLTADPHVWLDPLLFARIGTKIGAALHRPSSAFVAEMRKLDQAYRNGLRDCKRREIVTSHAAFGYLAARYGLEQVAITGLAPESEPSPQQLAHVVEVVRRTHATTVFFETLVSPRLAETVAREVGARTAVLDPIEGLTPDEQKRGDDYLTLMRRNLVALREALACR
jgi:zinc transport system substrate-binding protein